MHFNHFNSTLLIQQLLCNIHRQVNSKWLLCTLYFFSNSYNFLFTYMVSFQDLYDSNTPISSNCFKYLLAVLLSAIFSFTRNSIFVYGCTNNSSTSSLE